MLGFRPLALALSILVASFAVPADAQEVSEREISWLFILQGEVTAIEDDRITMSAAPGALAFTDRPERRVRPIDLATVLGFWREGGEFRADPPNAALIDETEETIGVIEITNIVGEGDQVVMTFNALGGGLPAVGDHIALTIDNCGCDEQPL